MGKVRTTFFEVSPNQLDAAGGFENLGNRIDDLLQDPIPGVLDIGLFSGPTRVGVVFHGDQTDEEQIREWLQRERIPPY